MKAFKLFILLGVLTASVNSFATLECELPHGKILKLSKNTVSFKNSKHSRVIASSVEASTRRYFKGFTKTVHYEGLKYSIHVEDKNSPSELNDYMLVKNNNGHEITYPIRCNKVK